MRVLGVIAALCVGLIAGYCGATEVADRKAERWLAEREALTDSLLVERGRVERLTEVATRPDTVRLPARRPVPVPRTSVPASSTPGTILDSLTHYKSLTDTLLREQAVLHDRIGRDAEKLTAFADLVAIKDSQITRLTNLVNSAPVKRPRGIEVLGVRLCPILGGGYAVLASGQSGPAVAVIQPFSCGD